MRLGIVGFGGVGKAFVRLLNEKADVLFNERLKVSVVGILDMGGGVFDNSGIDIVEFMNHIDAGKTVSQYSKGGSFQLTYEELIKKGEVDVIVEMTPTNKETGEPGMTHIQKALERGIHVVTSNKGPVMLAYKKLNAVALANGVQFGIGCTTGGALPSINGGMIDLAGSEILSIEGVLNGTTNFIINEMEKKGIDYSEALQEAQRLGIAETDPTLDVEGWDTASKLLILTNVLMNEEKTLSDITVEGITGLTHETVHTCFQSGKKIKLIGKTKRTSEGLQMSVGPEALDPLHPLFGADGKNKAVRYTSDSLGDLTVMGGASGVRPAAASILRDLINIHRGYRFSR